MPTRSGHASSQRGSGCGAFLLGFLGGAGWQALLGRVARREVFVRRAWKGESLGRGDAHFPRWALYPRAPRPRRLPARRRQHVRAGERERPAPRAPRSSLPRPRPRRLAQGLDLGLGASERLGRRSARAFAAGLRGRAPPSFFVILPFLRGLAVYNEIPGAHPSRVPSDPRVGPGLVRRVPGKRGSARRRRRRPVRRSGVSY